MHRCKQESEDRLTSGYDGSGAGMNLSQKLPEGRVTRSKFEVIVPLNSILAPAFASLPAKTWNLNSLAGA